MTKCSSFLAVQWQTHLWFSCLLGHLWTSVFLIWKMKRDLLQVLLPYWVFPMNERIFALQQSISCILSKTEKTFNTVNWGSLERRLESNARFSSATKITHVQWKWLTKCILWPLLWWPRQLEEDSPTENQVSCFRNSFLELRKCWVHGLDGGRRAGYEIGRKNEDICQILCGSTIFLSTLHGWQLSRLRKH